ncbi:hypothetical protein DN614_21995 [Klebsiella michiganensis]|uniref:hypothetical protein n=1 Tax=Klebsiella michiganensis TaxID=1134687 RepID=UPI000FEC10BD|nr:hypothetical protein [Klebsiella michiganensis]RWS82340.1 hypothetical protein DN614_21995 [Klebsiella michiganensis]
MWDPATSTSIEEVVSETNSLYELLDLMHLCFKRMNPPQTEALLGLALNIASNISIWMEAKEKRRENKSD